MQGDLPFPWGSVRCAAKSLRGCSRGAAAAELALVLPLLTSMILGVFEYGAVMYSYSAMQSAATRMARTVAVNRMSNGEARATADSYLPGWMANKYTVSVTQSAPSDPITNMVQVRFSIPASAATPLALITRIVPWQLTSDVSMKQELPYVD